MEFGRDDYDLETLKEKVGEDEPVFVLRAQDAGAIQTLAFYQKMLNHLDADEDIRENMVDLLEDFVEYADEHGVKTPDL